MNLNKRASGVLLHPTSLPGPQVCGSLGEHAYHFVNWLASAGQTLWQVLPLGELGCGNSPYMSPSAFAGNTLLIDFAELVHLGLLDPAELSHSNQGHQHQADFETGIPKHMKALRKAYGRFLEHPLDPGLRQSFETFCDEHANWLDDYALYMTLGEVHDGNDWRFWPEKLVQRNVQAIDEAKKQFSSQIAFWKFCQWIFIRQWTSLKTYANSKGVHIVGDIPYVVAQYSADVWAMQHLFNLDAKGNPLTVAGVPPDYFSEDGQLWGNPIYKWEQHAADHYAWWCERMRYALTMVDAVRLDHFTGFANFWEIPASEKTAKNGRWVAGPGKPLFDAMQARIGSLPLIAEDLGVSSEEVRVLRKQLDLPGMRVLQFAFDEDASHLFLPHNYEANTVAYCGTHDNDTLLGWWHTANPRRRAFIQHYLGSNGHAIQWDAMRALSASVANIVIFPMQDVLGLGSDHRMNIPGIPKGNWEWRFSWDQVQDWHAPTLAHFSAVHGRCRLEKAELPA